MARVLGGRRAWAAALFFLLVLASIAASFADSGTSAPGQAYPNSSWALGVVVPQGAPLQNGSALRWEDATNVTAVVALPNITLPDRVVYVVESVMTKGGEVLQVAAGVGPNDTSWFSYSWSIPDIDSVPLTYSWVLNHSAPAMVSKGVASISIFEEGGGWSLKVSDPLTGSSVERSFPVGSAEPLKGGDQEVLALESYSRAPGTFRDMGNFTLRSLLIDGETVAGGFYSYGDWGYQRNPVFAVGSSGTSPPGFIAIGRGIEGSISWTYQAWGSTAEPLLGLEVSITVLGIVAAAVLATVLWVTRRPGLRAPPARLAGPRSAS